MLGLLQQADPLARQLQFFEITGKAVVQLVPVRGVVGDEPGQGRAHQLGVDVPLRRQIPTQASRPPAQRQQQMAIGSLALVLLERLLQLVKLLGDGRDQGIHPIGQGMGEKQHDLRGGLRPLVALEGFTQRARRPDWTHAQGNDLPGIGVDAQRHHILWRRAGIQIDPAQEQQQALPA
ncbi:hypothetical protein D3C78_1320250 [compost metagenome]